MRRLDKAVNPGVDSHHKERVPDDDFRTLADLRWLGDPELLAERRGILYGTRVA